jgi:hypothetical protein
MNILRLHLCLLLACAGLTSHAADAPAVAGQRSSPLVGNWIAQFETPTGTQRYVYEFTGTGEWLAGIARWERQNRRGETPLQDIKLSGDAVSFSENVTNEGRETKVTYTGTLAGDEMRLTRASGDLAVEEIVVHRLPPPRAATPKSAAAPEKER